MRVLIYYLNSDHWGKIEISDSESCTTSITRSLGHEYPVDIYFYVVTTDCSGRIPNCSLPIWSLVIPHVKSITCPALKLYVPLG